MKYSIYGEAKGLNVRKQPSTINGAESIVEVQFQKENILLRDFGVLECGDYNLQFVGGDTFGVKSFI